MVEVGIRLFGYCLYFFVRALLHFEPFIGGRMRIDKYLKVTRLIKRRTVANEVADVGRIAVNGKIVKAGYQVKIGDIIEVTFGDRTFNVRVEKITDSTKKDDAREMYTVLEEHPAK